VNFRDGCWGPITGLRTNCARSMGDKSRSGEGCIRQSGGRGKFESCLEGATKQDHVCTFWPVYPAKALDAKSAPVGWRTQCGWHVSPSLAGIGCTHGERDGGRIWVQAKDSAAIMRYGAGSNATDVGEQRTTAGWGVGCAQI
jgi:hypothetical protein